MFSGVIERDQWHKMGQWSILKLFNHDNFIRPRVNFKDFSKQLLGTA